MRGGAFLDLVFTNEEELARHVKAVAVLAAVSVVWWNLGSCEEVTR